MRNSSRTYFRLGAEHWITDVARVAVGVERRALKLEVGILLCAIKRNGVLVLKAGELLNMLEGMFVLFTLMLRLEKCRFLE